MNASEGSWLSDLATQLISEALISAPWDTVGAVIYALVTLVASICGLRELRQSGGAQATGAPP